MSAILEHIENLVVVKIGGGEGLDVARCVADLIPLAGQRPLVVVHGVSAVMNQLCTERGIEVKTLTSPTGHTSRYTDAVTRDVFVEAAGRVGDDLVTRFHAAGIRASRGTGSAGQAGVFITGERKSAIRAVVDGRVRMVRDDYSGSITGVDSDAILSLLRDGAVPVIAPLAISAEGLLNIDGDRAAAAIAGALSANELVILSNVRGLYRNFPDESSFISQVSSGQMESALEWAQGRMKRKVLGAQEALSGGVRRVIIGDGRSEQPVSAALNGSGTHFLQS